MFGRRLEKLISAQHEEMREEFRQRREEFARLMEASERRTEETREYNREILLRNEKVYTSVVARLEKNNAQIESNTEETRAQTQALLRLIDRFDRPGGAAAA
jgi:hypothetical protein